VTGWGGGSSDPLYELRVIRVHRESGVVEQIDLSREALPMIHVQEHEWKPSLLQTVPADMKVVRRPRPRQRAAAREMPEGDRGPADCWPAGS
jgi:hypothetical protein